MSDDYRQPEKTKRLGDPLPPVSRCSACRGTTRVRGERCLECDGKGTLEGQREHMAKLVACAAAEKNPRGARHVVLAKGAAIVDLGAPVLELDSLHLGPGDVLVWRTSRKVTHQEVRAFGRLVRESLPPDRRPSVVCAIPFESGGLDVFNVGSGLSHDGVRLGLLEHGDKLQELIKPSLEAKKKDWKSLLVDDLAGRNETMGELKEFVDRYGLELTPKKTFAELMAERERRSGVLGPASPDDTPEERQRLAKALEAECLKVLECDSQGLFATLNEALAAVIKAVCLHERFLMVVMSNGARSRLGNPNFIHGVMVPTHMHNLTPDDRIVVAAVKEDELWDPGYTVVVRWKDTGDPLEGLKFYDQQGIGQVTGISDETTVGDDVEVVGKAFSDDVPESSGMVRFRCSCEMDHEVGDQVLVIGCGCGLTWDKNEAGVFLQRDVEEDVIPPEVMEKALKEYVEEREERFDDEVMKQATEQHARAPLDPEFVYATRGTGDEWSRERDDLKCVCGLRWVMPRGVEDLEKDCVCDRTLRKVQVTTAGSKWSVRSK